MAKILPFKGKDNDRPQRRYTELGRLPGFIEVRKGQVNPVTGEKSTRARYAVNIDTGEIISGRQYDTRRRGTAYEKTAPEVPYHYKPRTVHSSNKRDNIIDVYYRSLEEMEQDIKAGRFKDYDASYIKLSHSKPNTYKGKYGYHSLSGFKDTALMEDDDYIQKTLEEYNHYSTTSDSRIIVHAVRSKKGGVNN